MNFVTSLLLAIAVLAPSKPTEIVFVRHGETLANATGRYNSKTIDTFSPLGEKQVAALTGKLVPMLFDAIVVSPSPRALKTLAPYLRATRQRAEIWPELYECCDAHSKKRPSLLANGWRFGAKIPLPVEIGPLFSFGASGDRFLQTNSYDDGLKAIRLTADNLKKRFAGKTVLVVGHSLHGGRLIELLQGKPMEGKLRPGNTQLIVLRGVGSVFQIGS